METNIKSKNQTDFIQSSNKSRKYYYIFLGLALLTALSLTSLTIFYNYLSNYLIPKSPVPVSTSPTLTPDLNAESNLSATANWKTYTTKYFSMKIPNEWQIVTDQNNEDLSVKQAYGTGNILEFNKTSLHSYAELAETDYGYPEVAKNIRYFDIGNAKAVEYYVCVGIDGCINEYYTFIKNRDEYFLIRYNFDPKFDLEIYNQVLSTIKFIDNGQISDTSSWKTYTNTKYRFSFKYPEYFEGDTSNSEYTLLSQPTPQNFSAGEGVLVSAHLEIRVVDNPKNLSLKQIAQPDLDTYSNNPDLLKIYKTDELQNMFSPSIPISTIFGARLGGLQCGDYSTFYIKHESKIIELSFTCDDDFASLDINLNQILSTFKFTDQTTFDKSMILKTFSFTDSKNIIKNLIVVKKFQDKVRAEHAEVYLTDKNLSMTSAIRISQLSSEGNSMSRLASSLSDNSAVVSVSSGPGVKFIAVYDRVGDSSRITILDENGKVIKIIGMNTISELIGGKGMFGMQFGEWKDKSSFYVNIGLGNGEAYRALVDANTGNIIGSIQKI